MYEKRVELAGQGVVKSGGGTGFELFDRTNLGMTDFQEKIAKTRATEGELQRTISGLTPVQSARVHIASPQASLYSNSQQPTTASVAIQTKSGMQLSAQEVRGITQLVAGAVEGLKPENVTMVDQNGTVLRPSALEDGGALGDASSALKLTQDQMVAKEKYESDLQQSLQGLLDTTIGSRRSAVRVASKMDFDANSTETKTYAPQGSVLSEKTKRETYTGTGAARRAASGVPGTTTNVIPTYQGTQNQQGNGRYTGSEATRNFQVGEAVAKHVDAPGKVTRLSVAVLVNVRAPPRCRRRQRAPPPAYVVAAADVQKIRNASRPPPASIRRAAIRSRSKRSRSRRKRCRRRPRRGDHDHRLRHPDRPVRRADRDPRRRRRRVRLGMLRRRTFRPSSELPTFDSTLAEELPSFEEHPMLDGTPAIAAPIRSAADLTREQMIEYVTDRRSRKSRQHRQARKTMVGGIYGDNVVERAHGECRHDDTRERA